MIKGLSLQNPSLKVRIFISMIFLSFISSVLIALVAVYQFNQEAKNYHQERLERKEMSINEHISFVLNMSPYELTTENLPLIFKEKIHELATIHNIQVDIHDLQGNLLISSKGNFTNGEQQNPKISNNILKIIESTPSKRFVDLKLIDGKRFRSAYNYIKNNQFKPLGIVNLPYKEETDFYDTEMQNFLLRFSQIYLFVLFLSFILAFFLSTYITKTLQMISERIQNVAFSKKNEKIKVSNASYEINTLISSYNNMVDQLDASAQKLAQSEREQAWREMAKQVAHEIKNPLTPMRLTVQSFQRRFDPNDPLIEEKLNDFSYTLIQQIDTLTSVASAFSNFASMPVQENETLDIVKVVQLALEIFNEDFIVFDAPNEEIITTFDRAQIVRVITNLVKNAIQAIPPYEPFPLIVVRISRKENEVLLEVKDNGSGIPQEIQEHIFEPKFTTKNSGMGLGLAMIKNIVESYKGSIYFETVMNKGTTFYVKLPITHKIK